MRPQQGTTYTIQDENTLSKLAVRAYGDVTEWPRIWRANQTRLRSGNPDLIYPGEQVYIPEIPGTARSRDTIKGTPPHIYTIDIDGILVNPLSAETARTMDTAVNACSFTIPWEYGANPALDEKIKPYSYTPCKVYLGERRVMSGLLYGSSSTKSNGGTTKTLNIYTATADFVDSTLKPPLEFTKITLEDLLKRTAEPFGIDVVTDLSEFPAGAFDRVTFTDTGKLFDTILPLARQKNVLLSCTTGNDLLVTRAKTDSAPIATIEEDVTQGVSGWGSSWDGRSRFKSYRVISTTPFGNNEGISNDDKVSRPRFTTVNAPESQAGDIEQNATWERNKVLAETLSFELTVPDWYIPNTGQLWEENTTVVIISKTMDIPKGFTFLVNRVKYNISESGRTTTLSFVPPSAYTGGEIVEPW